VFSVRAAQLTWPELFGLIASDAVHPPLFYVLLKLWLGGGATLLWLKILPLIVSIAALVPFWLLCRELELTSAEVTLIFWMMAVNVYLIHYSQELRMYSLLFCLSLWSLSLFLRYLKVDRPSFQLGVGLFVANVLVVYTHYFGWLFVGAEWVCVLLWRRRLLAGFSVSVIAMAFLFAPWAYAVASGYSSANQILPPSLHWISKPGWAELLWYWAMLNGIIPLRHTTSLGIILFALPIAVALYRSTRSWRQSRQPILYILGVLSVTPVAVAFISSQLMTHSMWGERYLITVTLPYLMLVAMSISHVHRGSARIALIVAVVTWTAVSAGMGLLFSEDRTPWKSLVQHLVEQERGSGRHIPVYTFEAWAAGPIEFALGTLGNQQFDVLVSESRVVSGEHFWVVFRDSRFGVGDDPRSVLVQRGCRIDGERSAHDGAEKVVMFRGSC
jgi:uncharacterized membrane protein